MLTEERWSAILELVEKEKAISVIELEKELGVSASTIRRDLTQLNMMGKLLKVHGGATSIGTQYVNRDLTMDEKYTLYSEEKRRIAEFAANLIAPTDFVYIDAGTTTETSCHLCDELHGQCAEACAERVQDISSGR